MNMLYAVPLNEADKKTYEEFIFILKYHYGIMRDDCVYIHLFNLLSSLSIHTLPSTQFPSNAI